MTPHSLTAFLVKLYLFFTKRSRPLVVYCGFRSDQVATSISVCSFCNLEFSQWRLSELHQITLSWCVRCLFPDAGMDKGRGRYQNLLNILQVYIPLPHSKKSLVVWIGMCMGKKDRFKFDSYHSGYLRTSHLGSSTVSHGRFIPTTHTQAHTQMQSQKWEEVCNTDRNASLLFCSSRHKPWNWVFTPVKICTKGCL